MFKKFKQSKKGIYLARKISQGVQGIVNHLIQKNYNIQTHDTLMIFKNVYTLMFHLFLIKEDRDFREGVEHVLNDNLKDWLPNVLFGNNVQITQSMKENIDVILWKETTENIQRWHELGGSHLSRHVMNDEEKYRVDLILFCVDDIKYYFSNVVKIEFNRDDIEQILGILSIVSKN